LETVLECEIEYTKKSPLEMTCSTPYKYVVCAISALSNFYLCESQLKRVT